MNELSVFKNDELGQVRTQMVDGQFWFCLKDVCDILKLSNSTVVGQRLDSDERAKFNLGRQGKATFINESGLYSVILRSDKPNAKKFKKWVTSEVLPAIRKTGKYEQPKQLQIEEPYQVIKKTLHGKPVMTIRDIVHLTGESKQVIYWNTVHRNVAYVLLEGKELEEFKKENNLKHFWNSLIVLPREGVSRLFTVLGKSQDQVEEYFGKEKPSIKAFQDVYTLQLLKGFNQVMFISKEFREKLDTIISEEYIRLGLLSAPCKDLAIHTPTGWNLTNDILRFYRKFI